MIRDRIDRWLDGWSPWRLRRRLADMIDAYSALNASLEDAEAWRLRVAPGWPTTGDANKALSDALREWTPGRAAIRPLDDIAVRGLTQDEGDALMETLAGTWEGEPWTPDCDPLPPPEDR